MTAKKTTNTSHKRTRTQLSKLKVEPWNFQFRAIEIEEDHVRNLRAVVERGETLDPMTVWKRGENDFVVVNGHHRHEAYRRSGHTKAIPVVIHECSAAEAERLAIAENARTQLPLSNTERMDAAWKLVKGEHSHTKAQIVKATGVADGTVAKMRRTNRTLEERGGALPETWWMAMQATKRTGDEEGHDIWQEDIIDACAKALDDKIGKELGLAAHKQWEALAQVLARRLRRDTLASLTDYLWTEMKVDNEDWETEDLF